jgi:thiamine-monophosphate kinase
MTADPGLGPGREFDLVRAFLAAGGAEDNPDVTVGPGDDCAVVTGNGIALSSDMAVEEVHFRRDWSPPEVIGYRAATAALSDLAAMAARPIGLLASLAAPENDAGEFAERLMAGVREAAGDAGGVLLGGTWCALRDLSWSTSPWWARRPLPCSGPEHFPAMRSG